VNVYFDTSAIIPLLLDERTSPAAERLWVEADRAMSSQLLYAEARAAIARAHRRDRVNPNQRERAVGELHRLIDEIDLIDISDPVVRHAGELADRLALRAYDAMHLSSADLIASSDLIFASGDKPLLQAAEMLGVATANLN
jgi:predicted nucleic acid-binding protein